MRRGAAEPNGSATGDGRAAEVSIEFEDRSEVSIRDGKGGVVGQIWAATSRDLQKQCAEDLEVCATLDSGFPEESDGWSVSHRDAVLGGTADDDVSISDVLR